MGNEAMRRLRLYPNYNMAISLEAARVKALELAAGAQARMDARRRPVVMREACSQEERGGASGVYVPPAAGFSKKENKHAATMVDRSGSIDTAASSGKKQPPGAKGVQNEGASVEDTA